MFLYLQKLPHPCISQLVLSHKKFKYNRLEMCRSNLIALSTFLLWSANLRKSLSSSDYKEARWFFYKSSENKEQCVLSFGGGSVAELHEPSSLKSLVFSRHPGGILLPVHSKSASKLRQSTAYSAEM